MKGKLIDSYLFLEKACLLNKRAHNFSEGDWDYSLNEMRATATRRSTSTEFARSAIEQFSDEDMIPYRIIQKEYRK